MAAEGISDAQLLAMVAQSDVVLSPTMREQLWASLARSAETTAAEGVEASAARHMSTEDVTPALASAKEACSSLSRVKLTRRERSLGAEPPDVKLAVKPEDVDNNLPTPRQAPSPFSSASPPPPRSPAPSPSPEPKPSLSRRRQLYRDILNPWGLAKKFPALAVPPELMESIFAPNVCFIRQCTAELKTAGAKGSWPELGSGGNAAIAPRDDTLCLKESINGPYLGAGQPVVALVSKATRRKINASNRSRGLFIGIEIPDLDKNGKRKVKNVYIYLGAYIEAARLKWSGTRLAQAGPKDREALLSYLRKLATDKDHLRAKLQQWGVKDDTLTRPEDILEALIARGDSTTFRFSIFCCVGFKPKRAALLMERRQRRLDILSRRETKDFTMPRRDEEDEVEESEEEVEVRVEEGLLPGESEEDSEYEEEKYGREAGKRKWARKGEEKRGKGGGKGKAAVAAKNLVKKRTAMTSDEDEDDEDYASGSSSRASRAGSKKPRRSTRSSVQTEARGTK